MQLCAVRTVYRSEITRFGDRIVYDIAGSGFLIQHGAHHRWHLDRIGKGKLLSRHGAY